MLAVVVLPLLFAQASKPLAPAIRPAPALQSCEQRFLTKAFQDVLGRPLDASGSAYWSGLMKNGMSRTQVASQLLRSAEGSRVRVQALYNAYLHRPADASGVAYFAGMLQQGSTIEQVRAAMLGSAEYFQHGGATNQGFIAALYQDVLGRAADPQGITFFTQQIKVSSRAAVAQQVLTSPEGRQRRIAALYNRYLHRPASASASAYGGGEGQVAAAIIGSEEYCRR